VILYLDSSSLVKLYVEEAGSSEVEALVAAADGAATSRTAYAELRSALARKQREGGLSAADRARIAAAFRSEWDRLIVQEVTQDAVELAGDLSERHSLRALDAIHLASARLLAEQSRIPVRFSSSDRRLQEAAASEGMA